VVTCCANQEARKVPGFTPESVPLTWRLLTGRQTRLTVGALGVGLALMLILLLDGLWVGVQDRVTLFEDHTGAQLAVVAPGTDSLFADASSLPSAIAQDVATAAPSTSRPHPNETCLP